MFGQPLEGQALVSHAIGIIVAYALLRAASAIVPTPGKAAIKHRSFKMYLCGCNECLRSRSKDKLWSPTPLESLWRTHSCVPRRQSCRRLVKRQSNIDPLKCTCAAVTNLAFTRV